MTVVNGMTMWYMVRPSFSIGGSRAARSTDQQQLEA